MSWNHPPTLATLTIVALLGAPASAAVIQATVETRVDDRHTNGNYDELGNNAYPGQYLAVGDSSGSPQTGIGELRTVIEFDISAHTADILAAEMILFSIPYLSQQNNPQDFQLWALSADEDGTVTPDDYQAAGTLVASFSPGDYTTANQLVTADVTAFVKADAAAAQTWSAFRFQVANPAAAPNGSGGLNGTPDLVQFVTPSPGNPDTYAKLTTFPVPEPASLSLLVLGGVLTLTRRTT